MKIHEFKKSLQVGLKGEQDIIEFLKLNKNIKSIENVTLNEIYMKKDIDFIIFFKDKKYTIEIKTDTYDSGNLYYETISCIETKTLGCFEKTEADYIFYYFIKTKELYILDTKQYRKWFTLNINSFKKKTIKNISKNNNKVIHSQGYVIKKTFLENTFKYYKKYIL